MAPDVPEQCRYGSKGRMFVYLDGVPRKQGSGASLRFFSNLRACLDLGFEVEAVHIDRDAGASAPDNALRGLRWTRVPAASPRQTALGKLAFRAAMPCAASFSYYFPLMRTILGEAAARHRAAPGALHWFDGEAAAAAIPFLPALNAIWALHDVPSDVVRATTKIASELQARPISPAEQREYRFARRAERYMARHAGAVLCISEYDRQRLPQEWDCARIDYLPTSIADENVPVRERDWLARGSLRLLHLGAVTHLPSFSSLEFLLDRVFPLLDPETLGRIALEVVGRFDPASERCRRVAQLAARYPGVNFLGFAPDVAPFYARCDLQVVASTAAAGMRTRIVESFAYGLPVLSTTIGAQGIQGLRPGENILIADSAELFAAELGRVVRGDVALPLLAHQARRTYEQIHSRGAVAARFSAMLNRFFRFDPDSRLWIQSTR